MMAAFAGQLARMDIAITEKTVTGVYPMGDYYGILCNQELFEAKTVILATGVESVKPVPGELELLGRGVSYCATCDGFLYKGKTIAVVCTSEEYEHEIAYLADLAEKVYLFPLYRNCGISRENVVLCKGMPTAVEGERKVTAICQGEIRWNIDGVFFLKSAVSPAALVSGLQTEEGHVAVDRVCRTNLPGCFAAGDCTGRPYQYVKAAGEGNVAAHSAVQFLAGTTK
jgi:thioredoxin reductase (NADPH)